MRKTYHFFCVGNYIPELLKLCGINIDQMIADLNMGNSSYEALKKR